MKPRRNIRSAQAIVSSHASPTSKELLTWYRERDRDAGDLHRRYVRAKFAMRAWSDADLARYHRYRRSVSRERAAQLVIARRYAVRGLTVGALAAAIAGLIYAAIEWWKRKAKQAAKPALPAGPTTKTKPEERS